ncbi:MAG: NUDIX domain-containing protein [Bacillota bacterium]
MMDTVSITESQPPEVVDYIKYIRSMIGKKPFIGCTASVIVLKGDQTLMQRRADTGNWCYPGGFMEMGETVEQCAAREMYEEVGLQATALKFFGIFSGPEHRVVYPNGDEVFIVDHVYLCKDFTGTEMMLDGEAVELKWFSTTALPTKISRNCQRVLEAVFGSK